MITIEEQIADLTKRVTELERATAMPKPPVEPVPAPAPEPEPPAPEPMPEPSEPSTVEPPVGA